MAKTNKKSIEERIEDWSKRQLQGKTPYYTKNASVNPEIDKALQTAPSKKGGEGNNYPDIRCFIETTELRRIPVMIEVKGKEGDLVKLAHGEVANTNAKGEPIYNNISKYAVNGAIHYADAILRHTESYDEVIAVGINGYDTTDGETHEVWVYYISKQNLFIPKKVGEYSDLSFLYPEYVDSFLHKVDNLKLTQEELENRKFALEDDIEKRLKEINQKMHDELKIVVGARVKLITGLVMAGLGVKDKKVRPLRIEELTGETGEKSHDGIKIMNKIHDYLKAKNLPDEKIEMIENELNGVFIHSKLQEPVNGESRLHTLYADVRHTIIPFLTGELHNIDFTGRLFNVLNEWVDVPDGAENDVVLTPRYVTEFMANICDVNMDSYVWDFATGSGGFLISAMHRMIQDAKERISNPAELEKKILDIKMTQLLGIEKLPDVYLLAVLNMILMKDGSSNLIHGDSLSDFSGKYEQGVLKGKSFPANVFLLNPPYSADGKGFIFVRRALGMMQHGGMAAILIQENAGNGAGMPYTRDILRNNSLVASIKMADIFCGKANVQTAIYVFRVGTPHDSRQVVKFIDFSDDGYTRMNRKKSSQRVNLQDTDHAKERYEEVARLVRFGKGVDDCNLHYYKGHYFEDYITLDGNDWTVKQHQKIDTTPTLDDFRKVVSDYLAWKVSETIKNNDKEDCLGKN